MMIICTTIVLSRHFGDEFCDCPGLWVRVLRYRSLFSREGDYTRWGGFVKSFSVTFLGGRLLGADRLFRERDYTPTPSPVKVFYMGFLLEFPGGGGLFAPLPCGDYGCPP
jgi:hypothetical protein